MQTVCAFANEPGLDGGYLLLGVSEENKNFFVSGIDDVDRLLQELDNNCRNQFERPVTISAKVETLDGKMSSLSMYQNCCQQLNPVFSRGNSINTIKNRQGFGEEVLMVILNVLKIN